jgi:hypothetical protein
MSRVYLWPDIPAAEFVAPGGFPAGRTALDAPPRIVDNRTMVPLRFVGEVLGAEVVWDETSRQVTYSTSTRQIILTAGQQTVLVDGSPVVMDTAPVLIDGRTMVPVRFIARWLGAVVRWDETAKRVEIGYLRG